MLSEADISELYLASVYLNCLTQLILLRISTSALGIVLLCTMEFYRKKFVAHKSMKLLMTWHACWTMILCLAILVDYVMTAITHYTAKVPTDILLTSSQCFPRRFIGAVALYGSVSSMLVMALERRAASINFATYERASRSSGYFYVLIHLFIVVILSGTVWATYGDPHRTPQCTIVTPQGQIALNLINFVAFTMEIATIVIFTMLLRKNTKTLRKSKFKLKLTERYQLTENIRILKLFLPVVGSHTSITVAGISGYFAFQFLQPGPEFYPMFEDTINFVYMQGICMPMIFLYRYRTKRQHEKRLFKKNLQSGEGFAKTCEQKGKADSISVSITNQLMASSEAELEAAEFYYNSKYMLFLGYFRIVTSAIGISLLCTMEFYRNKFVAHKSLKLLMTWHAVWTIVYCLGTFVDNTLSAIAHYTATTPTDILLTDMQCLLRRLPDAIALYGSVSSMLVMAMERRAASSNYATYERAGLSTGYYYVAFNIAVVVLFSVVMASTYDYPELTPLCSIVTPNGLPYLYAVNSCLFLMESATIFIFSTLLRKNQKILDASKFESNLTEKYQLSENIRMLKLFLPVVTSHTTLALAGLVLFFCFQFTGLSFEYYPMFEDSINFIYMQGIFMPLIFLYRYRAQKHDELRMLKTNNRATGEAFTTRYHDVIQKGW